MHMGDNEGMSMRSISEIEIRDKLADLHFDIDTMSRKQLYESHRIQRQVNIAIVGMVALIATAFIVGVAVGGSI